MEELHDTITQDESYFTEGLSDTTVYRTKYFSAFTSSEINYSHDSIKSTLAIAWQHEGARL